MQALFLKQVALTAGAYFNVLLYPLFVLLLPVRLGVPSLVLLGFAVGMAVDYFTYLTGSVPARGGILRLCAALRS